MAFAARWCSRSNRVPTLASRDTIHGDTPVSSARAAKVFTDPANPSRPSITTRMRSGNWSSNRATWSRSAPHSASASGDLCTVTVERDGDSPAHRPTSSLVTSRDVPSRRASPR